MLKNIAFLLPFYLITTAARSIVIELPDNLDATNLTSETPEQRFARSDANNDKVLTFDEYLHMDLPYKLVKEKEFKQYDKNGDGVVSLNEYNQETTLQREQVDDRRAHYFGKIFEDFDENFDMKLDAEEVKRILAERYALKPRTNFQALFKTFDKNNDGGLDLTEYVNFDKNVPFEEMDPIEDTTKKTRSEKLAVKKKIKGEMI